MIATHRLKNLLFFIVVIDILVAPYIQYVIIPASLIFILPLFLLLKINLRLDLDFKIISAIVFCALLSTLSSIFLNGSAYVAENIKYFLQLTSSFLYFFAFKWYGMQSWSNEKFIKWPIHLFVVWYLYLVINYFAHPFETIDLIQGIYGRTTVLGSDFETDMRFPYLFSDPNTSVYFFLLSLGYLFNSARGNFNLFLLIFCGGVAALASQSTGGIFTWFIMSMSSLIMKIKNFRSIMKIAIVFSAIISLVLFLWDALSTNENFSSISNLALERLGDADRNKEGGGRLHHWGNLLSMYPLPLGRGHVLFDEGLLKFPHSDLLGFIYRYGWVAALLIFYFLFLKRNRFALFSIAALVPFLINALIEDQKFFGLYLILIGYISGRFIRYQDQSKNNEVLRTDSPRDSLQRTIKDGSNKKSHIFFDWCSALFTVSMSSKLL